MGCMSFLGIGFLALLMLLACGWFLYVKAVDMFTSDAPTEIVAATFTDADHVSGRAKLNALRNSLRGDHAATLSFTAPEVNAIIAREPEFASRKGRTRVEFSDSMATVDMSVPLNQVQLPRVKHRWFNGSTRFSLVYDGIDFDFDPQWIEANGHQLTGSILRSIASGFNRGFTTGFEESVDKDGNLHAWKNVKSIRIDGDQLIIETRGESGPSI